MKSHVLTIFRMKSFLYYIFAISFPAFKIKDLTFFFFKLVHFLWILFHFNSFIHSISIIFEKRFKKYKSTSNLLILANCFLLTSSILWIIFCCVKYNFHRNNLFILAFSQLYLIMYLYFCYIKNIALLSMSIIFWKYISINVGNFVLMFLCSITYSESIWWNFRSYIRLPVDNWIFLCKIFVHICQFSWVSKYVALQGPWFLWHDS